MALTTYTYSKADDFPNHVVNSDTLTSEITSSAIVTALDHIDTTATDCLIVFKAALSEGDETILDGIVAAHLGATVSHSALIKIDGAQTADTRLIVRQTIVNNAVAFRPRAITFYTADPSKLHNSKPDGSAYGDTTCKCYDANGDEITQAPYTAAVKTVIDFEPAYYYEMIGGSIDIPSALTGATSDAWYGACIGVPDITAEYGGSIDLMNEINLEADRDGIIRLDGRGVLGLAYDVQTHTNKIRFIFKHPAGESKRFSLLLEIFR
jgi:hypothetical protein